jgi:hypothetical protein
LRMLLRADFRRLCHHTLTYHGGSLRHPSFRSTLGILRSSAGTCSLMSKQLRNFPECFPFRPAPAVAPFLVATTTRGFSMMPMVSWQMIYRLAFAFGARADVTIRFQDTLSGCLISRC